MSKNNKHLCPCGSGKRSKVCCRQLPSSKGLSLSSSAKLEMRRSVEAFVKAGDHLKAAEMLEKLIAGSPRNPLIWNDLGIQYEASGQTEKAFAALTRGYECDPAYPPILYNLGKFTLDRFINLQEAGELTAEEGAQLLDKAAKFLDANLNRDPENADAHYNLALICAFLNNEETARAHMTVALRLKKTLEVPSGWLLG